MTQIELIDYLLKNTKDNSVIVKKVEVLVEISSFENSLIPFSILEHLYKNEFSFYIMGEYFIISRI